MEQALNAPVWIYEESFDEGWLGRGTVYERTMERFLRDKYAKRGIDIVVPVGDYPLQYMLKKRKALLPEAKLIYFSFSHVPGPIPQATGVAWKLDLAPTLEVALLQNPGTRHVLLITGATALDRATAQLFMPSGLKYLQEKHSQVDLRIIAPGTVDETRSALTALPQDTITVFIIYYGDSAGQGFVPVRMLSTLSALTNRPMYSWLDTFLGRGIVGGSLVSAEGAGAEVGNLAVRVLRGDEPGNIPEVSTEFRQNEFDWRPMKRWGIGMDKLPPGSTVINREYTFWELYKWRMIGLLALIAIEALLISVLIRLAFAQKRNLRQLAFGRELETLIAELAASFINLPAGQVNAEIEKSFQRLLEFFDLDQISLFEFSVGTAQLRLLCFRAKSGVEQPPAVLDLHQLPWIASHIEQGTSIVASHLSDLPEEASGMREILRAHGIRSFVAFPVQCNEDTYASLTFSAVHNEREWNADLVQSLRTITDILGSALERKYAEDAVHLSGTRLTGIIESAMDAIIAVDNQQRIVVFNATAERIFGCPMEEALGQTLDRFIPQRFRAQHHAHISHFAETGVTNRAMGTLGALRANGEEFPIEASISQVKTDGGTLFTVIVRDITERRQAEEALRESEGRFRLVANTAPVLIWMAGPDKLCTYFNQPWLDFTGRRLEAELGNGWAEGVHPDDLEKCLGTYTQAFDARQPFKMEYRLRGRDGNFRWILDVGVPRVNADGSFAGYIGSCMDLTERRLAEEALRESEARERARAKELEAILDAVPLPVRIAHDTACRRMTGNRAAYEQTRVPVGGNMSSGALPAEGPRYRLMEDGVWVAADMLPMQQAAATGKSVYGRALTVVYEDGTKRETVENAVPLLDEAGKPWGAVGTSTDLTELMQAQEALRQSESTQRLILDHLPVGVVFTSADEERMLYINPRFVELFGYSIEQFQTVEQWWPLAYPDPVYRERLSRNWQRRIAEAARTQGEIEPNEVTITCRDGTKKHVRVLGRVIGDRNFIAFIDLTDRKRAEQALRDSEQLKASILESLSSHIVVVDSMGIVAAVNDPKFDFAVGNGLLRVSVGTNYFEMCRSRIGENSLEVKAALDGVQRVFDGRQNYFELEYAVSPSPEKVWLLMSVTPLKGADRGIVISHQDITQRKRHEKAIQELSGRLISAQEQERSRIARELHDDVNQQLALLAIELQQLESFFPEDSSEGRQQVQALWKKTHVLSTEVQQLSHQLHSTKLEHLGIVAALRGLCGEFSAQHKIGSDFQCRQVPTTMDSDASLSLFRVAQESLHNVARHSRAKKVRMELIGEGGKVILRVSDDGVGFDPDARRNQTGLGMISMGERIRFVGGTLLVWSKPSMGTQVEATIPLSRETRAVNDTAQFTFTRRKTDKPRAS